MRFIWKTDDGSGAARNGMPVTVSTAVAVPVPALLLAESVTVKVPNCVAVPVMTPLAGFRVKPGGRPETA